MAKDAKRVSAGKKSKRKGSGFELKVAKKLQEWWGKGEFARSPGSGGWGRPQNREGFKAAGDVITTNDDFEWTVECKNQEGWTLDQALFNDACVIWEWWRQAVDECLSSHKPMLIFKKNFQKPMVMFYSVDTPGAPGNSVQIYSENKYFKDGVSVTVFPFETLLKLDPRELGRQDE